MMMPTGYTPEQFVVEAVIIGIIIGGICLFLISKRKTKQ